MAASFFFRSALGEKQPRFVHRNLICARLVVRKALLLVLVPEDWRQKLQSIRKLFLSE